MRVRYLTMPLLAAALASLGLAGCRKTEVEEIINLGYLPPFTLPDSLTVTYGQQATLPLPAEYHNLPNVQLALSFAGNAKLKVNATDSLTTLLRRAITVDPATHQVTIDAAQLYPTSTTSDDNGVRTPRIYLATLTATSSTGFKPVQSRMRIKVLPAQLAIAELPNTETIPYGYGLYTTQPLRYTVDYAGLNSAGTQLKLEVNGRPDGKVTLSGRQVVVAADAGDAAQKYEWIYDLLPTLTKDGYRVAFRQFRVVLMPKPKFFYGTYYSSLDLTVLENYLVIQLGRPFTSKAPTFYPEKYKGPFTLQRITKDGQPFTDTYQAFSVDGQTGQVTVKPNATLTEGTYQLTLRTKATTGLELETTLTLKMEQ